MYRNDKPTDNQASRDKEQRLAEQNRQQAALLRRVASIAPVNFGRNRFGPLMFMAAFGIAGLYFATLSFADPAITSNRLVNLSVEPSARQVSSGETLTVRVWADSLDKPMSAVDARLTYPADRLELVSVDGNASRFTVDTTTQTDAGQAVLSRAVDPAAASAGLTGRQFVGKAVFRARQATGPAGIGFAETSRILQTGSGANILEQTAGGEYMVSGR